MSWPIIRDVQEEGSDPDAIENMASRPCMEGFLRFQFDMVLQSTEGRVDVVRHNEVHILERT